MKKIILLNFIAFLAVKVDAQESFTSFISQRALRSSAIDVGHSVAFLPSGDLILYGSFSDEMDFNPGATENSIEPLGAPDLFLARYNPDNELVWAFNIGRIALNNGMEAGGIVVDEGGNIYISGGFSNNVDFDPSPVANNIISQGNRDAFVAKYNEAGEFQWVKSWGTLSGESASAIALDADGNIFVALRYAADLDLDPDGGEVLVSSAGGNDAVLIKLNSDASYQWHTAVSTSGNDLITELAIGPQNRIFVGATVNGATSGLSTKELYMMVVDSEGGNIIRDYYFNNSEVFNEIADFSFSVDGLNFYVTGRIQGLTDFDPDPDNELTIDPLFADPFIASYDVESGGLNWVKHVSSAGTEDYGIQSVESGGAVILLGSFDETALFVPGDFSTQVSSQGLQDLFLAAYDKETGDYLMSDLYGGSGNEHVLDAQFLNNGILAISGSFGVNLDLDPSGEEINSLGFTDVFFARFNYTPNLSASNRDFSKDIALFPVPADKELTLNINTLPPGTGISFSIISVVGKEVKKGRLNINGSGAKIDVSELIPGVYILDLQVEGYRIAKRFVKN